ncbi:MAG: PIN domain-containing protein [Elusimicrobia bacterium]|nr:PIN domain-containing protein [Elusimicrobiota bacterium]
MKRVFVDTSAWFAAGRREDPGHAAARAALDSWQGRLVTSDFVFDELITLVRKRAGHAAAARAGTLLRSAGVADLVSVTSEDQEDAWVFFLRHKDKAYSFTDCTSFALMRRLRIQAVVATDPHFRQAGFDVLPA